MAGREYEASALFCRVITEGILGLEPTGMNSFSVTPRLSGALPHLYLRNIYLCGRKVDIIAERNVVRVYEGEKLLGEALSGEGLEIVL